MERKLRSLFNYQKFEGNPRLAKMIQETEANIALNDEDLGMVNAAGDFLSPTLDEVEQKKKS